MNTPETPLESWKEIGAYLQRDATTARRWEKEEGLPVHRHSHKSRSSVYAYPSEIDTWRRNRRVIVEAEPARPWWRPLAIGAMTLACLIMVSSERPVAAADRAKQNRQIWTATGMEDPTESIPSADGRYIGYTDWTTNGIHVRDLVKGVSRRLAKGGDWVKSGAFAEGSTVSPDNHLIAYGWYTDDESKEEVRVLPIDGPANAKPRILHSGEGHDYVRFAGWSSDSKRLIVVRSLTDSSSQLVSISLVDGSMRVLTPIPWHHINARISPDGRYIAYDCPPDETTEARDIYVIPIDGGTPTPVVQHPAMDTGPVWSPDGSKILFDSDRTGNFSLWSVEMENGRPKGAPALVRADTGGIQPLGITRTGALQYIAAGRVTQNVYSSELGPDLKGLGTSKVATERFINSNAGASISPDGERLVYLSYRPGGEVLVFRNLKTGEERDLRPKVAAFAGIRRGYGPMWFPDGRSVLVYSGSTTQRAGASFYRVDVETGAAELVHQAGMVQGYRIAPDGRAFFYMEQSHDENITRLLRFDIESKHVTELKTGEQFYAVAVSPDGTQLAYVGSGGTVAGRIAIMPSTGGESREIFRDPEWIDVSRLNSLAWSPDQKYLLFARQPTPGLNSLWRVPVGGGAPEPMGIALIGRIKSPQIHPDGKRIFFSALQNSPAEVWALENFLPKVAAAKRN